MIVEAWISIGICVAALIATISLVMSSRATLALPLGYMINLLLIHLPGAFAYAISGGEFRGMAHYGDAVSKGIYLTAISTICFVFGLLVAVRSNAGKKRINYYYIGKLDYNFILYCLLAGWILAFGVGPLRAIPTVGAAIYFGSAIWMLAAIVGLSGAVQTRNSLQFLFWMAVLLFYPLIVLIFSGFMSYGAMAVIIVGSLAVIQTKNSLRSFWLIFALGFFGISIFVNYFESRTSLRATLWSEANFEQRVAAVSDTFRDFELFNTSNPEHLNALTMRLNQNEFVGIAAERLENGQVEYLHGRSFVEAILALIPRVVWTDKSVHGGSGFIVSDMTGLYLNEKTSWGVGNVMEFYINFGFWSLVPCFIILGWLIGWLDRRAAEYLASPDPSRALVYFLPCVALIQPNGSLVELSGGAFAATLAALGLRFAWSTFMQMTGRNYGSISSHAERAAR